MTATRAGLMALALAVAACGNEAPPAEAAPPTTAAAKPKPVAVPTSNSAVVVPYLYNPVGKRDPFRNMLEEGPRGPSTGPGDGSICGEPLCAFDIDQLTLVAVVSGDANPVAMVEDPAHTGHLVRRNSRVGKQGGKVTQIQRDCVVVTEYFQTPDGKVNPNRVNLCIKADTRSTPVLDLLQNKIFEAQ
jgi:type IV pilus assembly protein PilP